MTAYCPKCNEEIAEDEVVLVDAVTYCTGHAQHTTVYEHARWRDATACGPDVLCAVPAPHGPHNYWLYPTGQDTHCPGRTRRR